MNLFAQTVKVKQSKPEYTQNPEQVQRDSTN